jgi:hypothetical protein
VPFAAGGGLDITARLIGLFSLHAPQQGIGIRTLVLHGTPEQRNLMMDAR